MLSLRKKKYKLQMSLITLNSLLRWLNHMIIFHKKSMCLYFLTLLIYFWDHIMFMWCHVFTSHMQFLARTYWNASMLNDIRHVSQTMMWIKIDNNRHTIKCIVLVCCWADITCRMTSQITSVFVSKRSWQFLGLNYKNDFLRPGHFKDCYAIYFLTLN